MSRQAKRQSFGCYQRKLRHAARHRARLPSRLVYVGETVGLTLEGPGGFKATLGRARLYVGEPQR